MANARDPKPDRWILTPGSALDPGALLAASRAFVRRSRLGRRLRGQEQDDAIAEVTALAWQLGEMSERSATRIVGRRVDRLRKRKVIPLTDCTDDQRTMVEAGDAIRWGSVLVPLRPAARRPGPGGEADVALEDSCRDAVREARRLGGRLLERRLRSMLASGAPPKGLSRHAIKRLRSVLRALWPRILGPGGGPGPD